MVSWISADAVELVASHANMPIAKTVHLRITITSIRLFLPKIVDHLDQDIVERMRSLVANHPLHFGQIGHTPRHVLETGFVGLVVRDELDRGGRPAQLADALSELRDRDLLRIADIDHLAYGRWLVDQLQQSADNIGDVCEGTRLPAIAEHGD